MQRFKKISLIIPSYNEETNVQALFDQLQVVLTSSIYQFEYLFIDDGSTDRTLEVIKKISQEHANVFYLQLSRNFGHQNALKAGLDSATGDCVISMDCDLQHPPHVVLQMISKWEEGFDVVYTKRTDSSDLSWLKRKTSQLFYSFYNKMSDVKIERGTADFRLLSRRVVDAFSQLKESELFIRGLIKWAGFRQVAIEYEANERFSGSTKYTFKQMLSFAFKGLTSFSTRPLKLMVYASLLFVLLSMVLVPYTVISYFLGNAVSGWASIMITIIFFGSLQLMMIAVVGLYISKLVIQSKQRPSYIVRESNYKSQQ